MPPQQPVHACRQRQRKSTPGNRRSAHHVQQDVLDAFRCCCAFRHHRWLPHPAQPGFNKTSGYVDIINLSASTCWSPRWVPLGIIGTLGECLVPDAGPPVLPPGLVAIASYNSASVHCRQVLILFTISGGNEYANPNQLPKTVSRRKFQDHRPHRWRSCRGLLRPVVCRIADSANARASPYRDPSILMERKQT